MKDIIRQAVADAAEYLYCDRGYFAEVLMSDIHSGQSIILVAKESRELFGVAVRAEQLSEADEIKTLSISCEAWPESVHLAAIKGETVTISFDPATATPDQLRNLAQGRSSVPVLPQLAMSVDQVVVKGPGGFMTRCVISEPVKGSWPYNAARKSCADAALWLWTNREAATSQWLKDCSASNIVNAQAMACGHDEKMAIINSSVSVPRSKLEALREIDLWRDGSLTGKEARIIEDLIKYL